MSADEHQALHRIWYYMWTTGEDGCMMPDNPDALKAATGLSKTKQKRILKYIMPPVRDIFERFDGIIFCRYLEEKWRIAKGASERGRKGGMASGAKKKERNADTGNKSTDGSVGTQGGLENNLRDAQGQPDSKQNNTKVEHLNTKQPIPKKEIVVNQPNNQKSTNNSELPQQPIEAIDDSTYEENQHTVNECVLITGEPWRQWWNIVLEDFTDKGGTIHRFDDILRHIHMSADPEQRAKKGVGPLKEPHRYLIKETTKILNTLKITWPLFPKTNHDDTDPDINSISTANNKNDPLTVGPL